MRLEGKIAFVTGADVAVHYHSDKRGAEQTIAAIQKHGRRAELFQADFSEPDAAERLVAEVIERMGGLTVLVNNAGKGEGEESSLDIGTETFINVLNVDLVVPFVLAREAARHMVDHGGGSIINVTSVHEAIPNQGAAAYCAAKGGLRMVTRTLALELGPKGVRVNNIAPGMIATPMTASTLQDAEASAQSEAQIPMGRPGEQQEIANVALFLASDESSYVTGSSFFADGGLALSIQGT